jgi:uncharacterized membrane protein
VHEFQRLLFYFIIYSFIGWIIEGLFNLITQGRFIKPNFLMIPIKPMYGFAALLLIISKEHLPLGLFFLAAFTIPTFIEYITAWLMDHFYNIHFWSYDEEHFNYKGYICLKFSLYWGLLSAILVFFIHPILSAFYTSLLFIWHAIYPIVLIYLMIDFILTLTQMPIKNKKTPF